MKKPEKNKNKNTVYTHKLYIMYKQILVCSSHTQTKNTKSKKKKYIYLN